jgi:hypothetical protein
MTDSFIDQVRGLMFSPGAALERYGDRDLSAGVVYFLKLLCVSAGLTAVLYLAEFLLCGTARTPLAFMAFFSIIALEIWNVLWVFIDSFLCHAGVYLMGGRAGFDRTALAVMYSYTPTLLLRAFVGMIIAYSGANVFAISVMPGDINFPGILFALCLSVALWIWVLVIRVRGFMKYQGLTAVQAISALITAGFITTVIWVLLVGVTVLPKVFGGW